jgi:hypothetical protein
MEPFANKASGDSVALEFEVAAAPIQCPPKGGRPRA